MIPDTALIGRLTAYGKVLSFCRDRIADKIYNGVRTAQMRLYQQIPSLVNLAGEFLCIWYPSQPKTCRNCGADDHIARDSNSSRCFNCDQSGHRDSDCPQSPLCSLCKSASHLLAACPFELYSGNVEQQPIGKGANADKDDKCQTEFEERERERKKRESDKQKAKEKEKEKEKGKEKEKAQRDCSTEHKDSRRDDRKEDRRQQERREQDCREHSHREEDRRDHAHSDREDRQRDSRRDDVDRRDRDRRDYESREGYR